MHIFHICQAPSSIKISKAEWRYQNSLTIIVPPEKSVALWRPTVPASFAPTHHFFSDNETSSGFNEVLVGQVEGGGYGVRITAKKWNHLDFSGGNQELWLY